MGEITGIESTGGITGSFHASIIGSNYKMNNCWSIGKVESTYNKKGYLSGQISDIYGLRGYGMDVGEMSAIGKIFGNDCTIEAQTFSLLEKNELCNKLNEWVVAQNDEQYLLWEISEDVGYPVPSRINDTVTNQPEEELLLGDMNKDGKINIVDVKLLLQLVISNM